MSKGFLVIVSYIAMLFAEQFTFVDAIISYNEKTNRFVSAGVDCHQEIQYELTEQDQEFLKQKLLEKIETTEVFFSYLMSEYSSKIVYVHVKVRKYHFFLVIRKENLPRAQFMLAQIMSYFSENELIRGEKNDLETQSTILYNFHVGKSYFDTLCDHCQAKGMCAPKYLAALFSQVPKIEE